MRSSVATDFASVGTTERLRTLDGGYTGRRTDLVWGKTLHIGQTLTAWSMDPDA